MVFNDIPAGTDFYFGTAKNRRYDYATRRYNEEPAPMKWRKTALDGLSVEIGEKTVGSFDHPRPTTGTNKSIRAHGHRLFFLSSLCKYLNCADNSWMSVDAGDRAPSHSEGSTEGFLSRFSEDELKYLEKFTMKINVPTGYVKQYGTQMEQEVLVGIPSQEQVGVEGREGAFGPHMPSLYTWLSDGDTLSHYHRNTWTQRTSGDNLNHVAPIIKIKADAPVDTDSQGRYVIRVPEKAFEGDLDAFLGFEAAA